MMHCGRRGNPASAAFLQSPSAQAPVRTWANCPGLAPAPGERPRVLLACNRKIARDPDQPPSATLARCTAALGPPLDVPNAAVGSRGSGSLHPRRLQAGRLPETLARYRTVEDLRRFQSVLGRSGDLADHAERDPHRAEVLLRGHGRRPPNGWPRWPRCMAAVDPAPDRASRRLSSHERADSQSGIASALK